MLNNLLNREEKREKKKKKRNNDSAHPRLHLIFSFKRLLPNFFQKKKSYSLQSFSRQCALKLRPNTRF